MARIVAARLEHTTDVDSVLQALASQGFQQSEFQSFYVNPRGQHALYTIGGDAYSDEGAKRGGIGALTGAAIGGVIGLGAGFGASIIIDSPLAVLVGGAVGACRPDGTCARRRRVSRHTRRRLLRPILPAGCR